MTDSFSVLNLQTKFLYLLF